MLDMATFIGSGDESMARYHSSTIECGSSGASRSGPGLCGVYVPTAHAANDGACFYNTLKGPMYPDGRSARSLERIQVWMSTDVVKRYQAAEDAQTRATLASSTTVIQSSSTAIRERQSAPL